MDTTIKPLVSIIMCTYNRAQFLDDAIQSVFEQSYTNWELIILDDASQDATKDIVTPYLQDARVSYIKNEVNLGITKNRNKGLLLSNGDYIAVLDSDDMWIDKEKLAQQISIFEKNHNLVLVGTAFSIVDTEGKKIKTVHYNETNERIRNAILIRNQFCHSSVLYKKKDLTYDESLPIWEDYDLWLRLGKKGSFANIPTVTVAYRQHGSQSDSHKKRVSISTIWKILERHKDNYPHYHLAVIANLFRYIRG